MSYLNELEKISRTKVDLLKLKMGHCKNTFSISPCTATGAVKCYNTFPTCQDKPNFVNITKTYKFINANLPLNVVNEHPLTLPYIHTHSNLPTEIKEKDTVVRRLKVKMYDDNDNDVLTDPYRDGRSQQGLFWKKFIARNRNYKGRIAELYQGFEGLTEDQFQMIFAGRLDNFEYNKGIATLEMVDLMKKLSETKYPFNTGVKLDGTVGNYYEAFNQAQMIAITDAEQGDVCRRKDFTTFAITGEGWDFTYVALPTGVYYYKVVAFDVNDNPLKIASVSVYVDEELEQYTAHLTWSAVAGATYYQVWGRTKSYSQYWHTTAVEWTDQGVNGVAGVIPAASRHFRLDDWDPADAANWTEISSYTIDINDAVNLTSSGYIKIGEEIIYYASKNVNTLEGIRRQQYETKAKRYADGAVVYTGLSFAADNPFTTLKNLLILAGIPNEYISSKFDDYETTWGGFGSRPKVALDVINKEVKLSALYFDLVTITNCMSWVNEEGKIDILDYDEDPSSFTTITDEANIISGSIKVDYNEESRKTRWTVYWNRYDLEKGIAEQDAYDHANITIDADAESNNEYGDRNENVQYTVWLNGSGDDLQTITDYLDDLLEKRRLRYRDAPEIVELEVELKDSGIKAGDVIKLSTSELQDKDGYDYTAVQFRVIKKDPLFNKYKLKLKRRFKNTVTIDN